MKADYSESLRFPEPRPRSLRFRLMPSDFPSALGMSGSAHPRQPDARDLFQEVYDELRAVARERLRHEHPGHTLQATALVHEVYARIEQRGHAVFNDRRHFFATAVEAMRHILIDHARARGAEKRQGHRERRSLLDVSNVADLSLDACLAEVTELDQAIEKLGAEDPRCADVVRLRFFAGLGVSDVAEVLGISEATVKREWEYAKAWLLRSLGGH